jgi:hypothetical protein
LLESFAVCCWVKDAQPPPKVTVQSSMSKERIFEEVILVGITEAPADHSEIIG